MWKNTAISQGQKQGGHGGMALHAAPIRAARLKMAPTHHLEGIQTSWARLRRLISPAGRPKMRPKNGTRVETLDSSPGQREPCGRGERAKSAAPDPGHRTSGMGAAGRSKATAAQFAATFRFSSSVSEQSGECRWPSFSRWPHRAPDLQPFAFPQVPLGRRAQQTPACFEGPLGSSAAFRPMRVQPLGQ